MKFICLGYIEPAKFEGMTGDERHTVLEECSSPAGGSKKVVGCTAIVPVA